MRALSYYAGIGTDNVKYQLHWPPGTKIEGEITGPIYSPGLVNSETILGTIGPVIPLIVAVGLIASFNKNLISIKVT